MTTRTRFAPSPTGDLHLGGASTALASWALARSTAGRFVLRVEDIDRPRVVPGADERIQRDLRWLGLDWDEGPYRQSERTALYDRAIEELAARDLVYPCDCSRSEIARVASAPHPGEEAVYPGTCRDRDPARSMRRPPCVRVRVPDCDFEWEDAAGRATQNLAREVGDFVLRRGDGVYAYQLAVVVDDLDMRITHVVRGADLRGSTPRQIWLANVLGRRPPSYAHVPLVVSRDGSRLEKRTPRSTARELREKGVDPERVLGALAQGLGLASSDAPVTPYDLALRWRDRPISWPSGSWPIPEFA